MKAWGMVLARKIHEQGMKDAQLIDHYMSQKNPPDRGWLVNQIAYVRAHPEAFGIDLEALKKAREQGAQGVNHKRYGRPRKPKRE